jgi:hypothetical protein
VDYLYPFWVRLTGEFLKNKDGDRGQQQPIDRLLLLLLLPR